MTTGTSTIPSTRPSDPAPISFEHVTKSYESRLILDDVSFSIESGAVTGLLGPNGSGKTTMLRCLLGLASPDSGICLVEGNRYDAIPVPSRLVGALCENAGLHPNRRAAECVALARAAAGLTDPHAVDAHLEQVGLADAGPMRVREMSLGMRQRLSLALALVGDPHVLVLDEPSNGLDPEGMEWFRTLLRRFAASGGSVLITSHILAELQRTIDAVVIVRGGRVVAQSDTLPDDLDSFYLATSGNRG
ncbi:ABC transporter, ATP-binding protein [Propionibacterium acidifaciens F0233]|uniref:ABC transporter, ATP-binding protein n=1 Tax=Propionibacterium acidifaciens F0233 TaxID=553198 RepID=U2S6U0_9ACTN|nr:ATP-binding cassette domain-containing protein [Propionibacterium acidifaciens]ERK61378.1 ABC transporter, ATP-binding protein [Propionibacterium acidifaciens F0233]